MMRDTGRTSLDVIAAPPAPVPIDAAGLEAALKQSVAGEVRFDRLSRALYSTDASVYQIVPLGIVLPRTQADVLATVRACARFRVPLTARGGGTSQAGQAIGPGLQLDCSRYLNQILEINPAERWARVEPGCVLDDLNLEAKRHGLQFAPDVSTSNRATIGGMIANNSSGAHSLIHGKTVDHVLELKVVLADGSIVDLRTLDEAELKARCRQTDREGDCYRTVRRLAAEHAEEIERRYPRILRRVGGYNLDLMREGHSPGETRRPFNLAHLLVGSEGTLAVTLEARVSLVELPRAKALLVIQFADLLEALAATPVILTHHPAAVEVTDKYILDSTRKNAEAARLRDFLAGDPAAVLLVEFYGDRAEDLLPRLDALVSDLKRRGLGDHYHRATDPAAQARIWKLRKMSLGLSMLEKGDPKAISFVEDSAVAPECLRDYIAEFLRIVARHGTTAGVYAHASVGCLHVRPVIDLKTEAGVRQFESIAEEVSSLVLKYGGAFSGEHGDGLVRSPFQEKMFGPILYQAFREIKRTFDPENLLNPGKIVDAPPLTSNLRYGARYVTPDVPTTFDFTADGGLTRAAELCAGLGECRKSRDGNMCPSFRATRDEQHCTRGRANALRLAITGQLGLTGLTDPDLHAVLDLCLECKACKSECPTNVDMARLKAEFLAQYCRKHGIPWRNWLFGNVGAFSQWGSQLSGLFNGLMRSGPIRWLNEMLLGIDRRRLPPALADEPFVAQWFRQRKQGRPNEQSIDELYRRWTASRREQRLQAHVLLFPDTFTNYYEPAIGLAATELLTRLGCQVMVGWPEGFHSAGPEDWPSQLRCCGRPLISNGLLAQAVEHARHNVERLYPWAAAGGSIITCEPSCVLTMKDDYPALLRGDERQKAETVAGACLTFEECAEAAWKNFGTDPAHATSPMGLRAGPRRILVQAHCHQRSLTGMQALLGLLKRIPQAEVIDLDAGCCGMAGSFGYEREHYETSRQVGEDRLFPLLRARSADAVVVAPGFSCRKQIEHFADCRAVHPAELLQSALPPFPGRE